MPTILLVTATDVEVLAVQDRFKNASGICREDRRDGRLYYYLGEVGGISIFMVRSEMGSIAPGASFETVSNAIRNLSPAAIIGLGICYGIKREAEGKKEPQEPDIEDILISQQLVVCHPVKLIGGETINRGDKATASLSLLPEFKNGKLTWKGQRVKFGVILSGDNLVNDIDFINDWQKREPEAIGGEMEGAGIYAASREGKVEWLIVKGICDWADGTKNDAHQKQAAYNAVDFTLHVIKQGGLAELPGSEAPSGTDREQSVIEERDQFLQQLKKGSYDELNVNRGALAVMVTPHVLSSAPLDFAAQETLMINHFRPMGSSYSYLIPGSEYWSRKCPSIGEPTTAIVKITKTGAIYSVTTEGIAFYLGYDHKDPAGYSIQAMALTDRTIRRVTSYLYLLHAFGLKGPFYVSLFLVNLARSRLDVPHRLAEGQGGTYNGGTIKSRIVKVPSKEITHQWTQFANVLQGAFDDIWNDFGFDHCIYFSKAGEWKGESELDHSGRIL